MLDTAKNPDRTAQLKTLKKVQNLIDWLLGLTIVAVVITLIFWIWDGDWRPFLSSLVIWVFFALLERAALTRRKNIQAGKADD